MVLSIIQLKHLIQETGKIYVSYINTMELMVGLSIQSDASEENALCSMGRLGRLRQQNIRFGGLSGRKAFI